ncbi:ArsR/SmtB family transcription factor [Leucobacter sp. W1478]|uniref:ArsR/SmtB family transcription factor n=1 Tax=Leucobacter sp. W1478 TaxID=3439065 RepID=UPI003F30D287
MSEDSRACTFDVRSPYVDVAAEIFRMLSDPTRIRILLALRTGELSVNHIADIVDKTPTVVSQHLAKMRLARLVQTRRQGTTMFYSLTDEHASRLVTEAVFQAEHAVDDQPHHHSPGTRRPGSTP